MLMLKETKCWFALVVYAYITYSILNRKSSNFYEGNSFAWAVSSFLMLDFHFSIYHLFQKIKVLRNFKLKLLPLQPPIDKRFCKNRICFHLALQKTHLLEVLPRCFATIK